MGITMKLPDWYLLAVLLPCMGLSVKYHSVCPVWVAAGLVAVPLVINYYVTWRNKK